MGRNDVHSAKLPIYFEFSKIISIGDGTYFFGVTTCYVTHRKTARRLKTVRQGFENVSDANLQLC